jgi:hypothetical protein
MSPATLRVLVTTDFLGSFFPRRTSFGALPGGAALRDCVERLRDGALASHWVDTGDFAQGGPLAPVTGGVGGFLAAAELGLDAAACGNHELDWGVDHLRRRCEELPFPLLASDDRTGLPATKILATGPVTLGVVAVSHPAAGALRTPADDLSRLGSRAAREALRLRAEGADFVVAAVHDGADPLPTRVGVDGADPARVAALCGQLSGHVDAILAGHTLGRRVGEVAGVPFVQPWAFGCEVGFVDLTPGEAPRVGAVEVRGGQAWEGHGAELAAELRSEVLGGLAVPLTCAPGLDMSLPRRVGERLLRDSGAEVAMLFAGEMFTMQPPRDGAYAYLAAGPLNAEDLFRAVPWADDGLVRAGLTRAEFERLRDLGASRWGMATVVGSAPPSRSLDLMISAYAAREAAGFLDRDIAWSPAQMGTRDAVRAIAGEEG